MLNGFHDIYRRMWKNIYPCVHVVWTVLIMKGVHTDLGEVVGVDGKVEEDIGKDELEGWQQPKSGQTSSNE